MEASKRPAENGSNGNSTEAKKAKLDPECGVMLFCGTTEWQNVSLRIIFYLHIGVQGFQEVEFYLFDMNVFRP